MRRDRYFREAKGDDGSYYAPVGQAVPDISVNLPARRQAQPDLHEAKGDDVEQMFRLQQLAIGWLIDNAIGPAFHHGFLDCFARRKLASKGEQKVLANSHFG